MRTQDRAVRSARHAPDQRAHDLAGRLLVIGAEVAARLPAVMTSIDHGDLLYDVKGLPA